MVDLETLGIRYNDAMLSIGACVFDPNGDKIGDEFHMQVGLESCFEHGLGVQESTLLWWFGQSEDARQNIIKAKRKSLQKVMYDFNKWLPEKGAIMWSHGLTFDVAKLQYIYEVLGWEYPWNYGDVRDTRTLFSLVPYPITKAMRGGTGETKHDALDDAKMQARAVQDVYAYLGSNYVLKAK